MSPSIEHSLFAAAGGEPLATEEDRADAARHPRLRARSLTASYHPEPRQPQIDEINLELAPGEMVAVIGPNGSGKSTLLRALSRTLPPRRGAVLIDEADLYAELSPRHSARAIAVVPQAPDVFLDFTVRDIVAMGRAPYRAERGFFAADTPADEAAVSDALARAGIDAELAARPISRVSGGERQRALIARSLAQQAPILLLDEPVSALDPRHQRRLLGWLRQLAEQGKRTVVAVLHDLNAAAEFADRIIVLSDGKIAADGPVESVLTADMISRVYGVRTWIRSNPATGRLCVLPAESITSSDPLAECGESGIKNREQYLPGSRSSVRGRRIHLFCGGGTGAGLMFALAPLGAALSACALHEGDADLDAARSLGIAHALAPAFSRPDAGATETAEMLAADADAAVLTGVERGEINESLFQQAAAFASAGKPLIHVRRGSKNSEDRSVDEVVALLCREFSGMNVLRGGGENGGNPTS